MAAITPTTTYPNGSVISVNGHNANVYSTVAGKGIFSEPNGGLGAANASATFKVVDEHIMPEEAVMARMDSTTVPMDVYSNAFGTRSDQNDTYVAIAGLSERVYLPYDMSAVIWQWSFFASGWIPYFFKFSSGAWGVGDLWLRLFIDDVEYATFRRSLPITGDLVADADISALASPDQYYFRSTNKGGIDREQPAAQWFDISKLQKNVSKGFHELTVKLYMPRLVFSEAGETSELTITGSARNFSPEGGYDQVVDCFAYQRITLGTRNVRCVAFK